MAKKPKNTAHFCENRQKSRQNQGPLYSCQFAKTHGFQLPTYRLRLDTSRSHIQPVSNKAGSRGNGKVNILVFNLHNKLQIMFIKIKTFFWKRKSTAFWQKHCILAKSRHSWHL